MDQIRELQEMVDKSDSIVFFGGAGVSTESGIPDFRSKDGLYNQQYKFPPEEILSRSFFDGNPEEFYRFYKNKILDPALNAKPNKAHLKLAEMEEKGKLSAVVTQNIDGLHQKAGSRNVLELHGSIHRNFCMDCGNCIDAHEMEFKLENYDVPRCSMCSGLIKPGIVLYEESLDEDVMQDAIWAIHNADMLIIAGTSLEVYPAAYMIDYFRGDYLVVINLSPTPRDRNADLVISEKIGDVLVQLKIY